MSRAFQRHYEAIQQLARDEWPPDESLAESDPADLRMAQEEPR